MPKGPKRQNLKGPGTCIFCGRVAGTVYNGITISMSKQHLWPEWMQKPFPETETTHTNSKLKFKLAPGRSIQIDPFLKIHQGDIKTRQLRILCEYHCNNGWVNHVEDSTKEFLIPLINGDFFTLTGEHQAKFALWLAIACIVWEYTDPPTQAIPKEDRDFIYEKRKPPPNWSMWVGNYKGNDWKNRYRHHGGYVVPRELFAERDIVGPNAPNSQTSSLQIGELFMHVSSSTVPTAWQFDHGVDFPGMLRLWPLKPRPIQWPNLTTLDDASALAISDRMMTVGLENLKTVNW
jgi:hypothetical protein